MRGNGILVLTQAAQEEVISALMVRRETEEKKKDDQIPDDWKLPARVKKLTWDGLLVRLKRCRLPGRVNRALQFAEHVLQRPLAKITERVGRSELRGRNISADAPTAPAGQLRVDCPDTIYDHRLVVVGELPQPGLYPLVVVGPNDRSRLWYPQPRVICVGRAFACFVNVGNPHGIGHVQQPSLPVEAEIRIYVLPSAPQGLFSDPLRQGQLLRRLKAPALPVWSKVVTRPSGGIKQFEISDASGSRELPYPKVIPCTAPVTLRWSGDGNARLEIRRALRDVLEYDVPVADGVVLTMGSSKQPPPGAGLTVLNLGKPGLYRVKVYPAAWRTFADALHEWWLQIADGSPERPAKRRSRLSSQGPVELRAPDPG